jgi:UDP-Gal:alpha-D-GlcNAc-diphosphoundecaprenol beta-1,4-galactosyltransferase
MDIESKIGNKDDFDNIISGHCTRTFVSFVNPFSYKTLMSNKDLIDDIDIFFIDGNLLRILHSLFHARVERISFDYSSIASDVFEYAIANNLNVGLVGATESELELALQNITMNHSGLNIVYARNGYFSSDDEICLSVNELNDCNVNLLIVGMGAPYQEKFLSFVKKSCRNIVLAFSCGGFITQTAIRRDYYYPIIKRLNLMWLQRMVMHSHVRKRILFDYPIFIFKYISSKLKRVV